MAHHVRAHHNGTNADITSIRVQGTGQQWRHSQPTSRFASPTQTPSVNQSALAPKVLSKYTGKSGRKKLGSPGMKLAPAIRKVVHKNDMKEKIMSSIGNDPSSSRIKSAPTHENAIPAVVHAEQEMETPGADLDSIFDAFGDQMKDLNVEITNIEPDSKLLSMVSDILAREEGNYEPELVQSLDTSIPDDLLDGGMSFLAPGSDNATDAEMECLAYSDGVLSTPDSNLASSPGLKGFLMPPEVSELPR